MGLVCAGAPGHGRAGAPDPRDRLRGDAAARQRWCRSKCWSRTEPLRLVSPLGAPLPLHCTAAGQGPARLRRRGRDQGAPPGRPAQAHRAHPHRSRRAHAAAALDRHPAATPIDMGEYVEDVRAGRRARSATTPAPWWRPSPWRARRIASRPNASRRSWRPGREGGARDLRAGWASTLSRRDG